MKSLVHLSSSIVHSDLSGSTKLCLNPDDGALYTASIDPTLGAVSVSCIAFSTPAQHQSRIFATLTFNPSSDQDHLQSVPPPAIIDLKVLPESCQLCLVTSDGQISVCSIEDQDTDIVHPTAQASFDKTCTSPELASLDVIWLTSRSKRLSSTILAHLRMAFVRFLGVPTTNSWSLSPTQTSWSSSPKPSTSFASRK